MFGKKLDVMLRITQICPNDNFDISLSLVTPAFVSKDCHELICLQYLATFMIRYVNN